MNIELRDIHKHYGPVRACDGVTLSIQAGSIHGLLGENGAGKSTLMKILSGYVPPDSGSIRLDGQPVAFASPVQALHCGVGMLHQDPLDFLALSVLDNFLVGSPGRLRVHRARARHALADLAAQFDFSLDADARVGTLSIGQRQQLEIVRLLWLGARALILDEPTTAISAQQKSLLFAALRRLAAEGRTVIFVSHKLDEVQALCHRVTVLAQGQVTGEAELPCPTPQLVRMMFGQDIAIRKREPPPPADVRLDVRQLAVSDGWREVRDVSFQAGAGEVIGLAGLEGSGQRLLLQACAGLARPTGGEVRLDGHVMTGKPYHAFQAAGVAYIPGNRLDEGLISGLTLTEHVALSEADGRLLVDWPRARAGAVQRIARFAIRGEPHSLVNDLSGGNQQRALLSLLPPRLRLLLMEHPTRGLDMESIEAVWAILTERTAQGTTILFASSDLDELLDRSDRILVFFGGRVSPPLDARTTDVGRLGELIGGRGFEPSIADPR